MENQLEKTWKMKWNLLRGLEPTVAYDLGFRPQL